MLELGGWRSPLTSQPGLHEPCCLGVQKGPRNWWPSVHPCLLSGTLPHRPDRGRQRLHQGSPPPPPPPASPLTAASPSTQADSSGSDVPPPLPLQLRALGLPPGSGHWAVKEPRAAREAGIRTITPNDEILAPATTHVCTGDAEEESPFGADPGCLSGLPEPWLSALLLKCRTVPLQCYRDDTRPGTWESAGTRPRGGCSERLVCDLRCHRKKGNCL